MHEDHGRIGVDYKDDVTNLLKCISDNLFQDYLYYALVSRGDLQEQ
jgi:hypothetical protein